MPAMPPLVAISGKMKSGKDTLATALQARWPTPVPIDHFAAPLKRALGELGFPLTTDADKERCRALLQSLGAQLTNADPWHFVSLLQARHPRLPETGLIIPDMRRVTEFLWAASNDFVLVRLGVSRETQLARGADARSLNHATETQLDHLAPRLWDVDLPDGWQIDHAVACVQAAWREKTAQIAAQVQDLHYAPLAPEGVPA